MEPDSEVRQVRSFNRVVTQRVGALQDHYLSRDRPLGEARVLWEIGPGGCDVRAIRSRLGLDAGYLSRLLRSLEAAGLVTITASDQDGRVRTARLTTKGKSERAILDRRSDALARTILEPLTVAQRTRLVSAMGEVEKLLDAAFVEIAPADPADRRAERGLRHPSPSSIIASQPDSSKPKPAPPRPTRCGLLPGCSCWRLCARRSSDVAP